VEDVPRAATRKAAPKTPWSVTLFRIAKSSSSSSFDKDSASMFGRRSVGNASAASISNSPMMALATRNTSSLLPYSLGEGLFVGSPALYFENRIAPTTTKATIYSVWNVRDLHRLRLRAG